MNTIHCAELDAYYARLYGLTRDELRHILDPKEVHGEDFPGETFRVLKEKEIRQVGDAPGGTKMSFEYSEYNVLVNSPIRHIDYWHKNWIASLM